MSAPVTELPLRELWNLTLAPRGLTPHAPLLHSGRVVVRCGNEVVAADAGTGARLWSAKVDPEPLAGDLLVDGGDVLVTDQRRQADKTTNLVGLDWDGRQVWTRELRMRMHHGSAATGPGRLVLVGIETEHLTQFIVELEPATGTRRTRYPLGWRADALALHAAGLLVTCRHAVEGVPGLYLLPPDDGDARPVVPGPVERVLVTERSVLTLGASEAPTVEARDVDSLAPRWSAPASEASLGAEGGDVCHVEGTGEQRHLVLRDEATGAVRWRAEATQSTAVRVLLANGLVVVNDMDGLGVYRRRDGAFLGYEEGSFSGATAGEDRLYVAHRNTLRCLSTAA